MIKQLVLLTVAVVFTGNLAFAQHKHPADVAQINAGLPNANLSPAKRAEVIKLRDQGFRQHNAGNHGAAEASLERAKAILRGG